MNNIKIIKIRWLKQTENNRSYKKFNFWTIRSAISLSKFSVLDSGSASLTVLLIIGTRNYWKIWLRPYVNHSGMFLKFCGFWVIRKFGAIDHHMKWHLDPKTTKFVYYVLTRLEHHRRWEDTFQNFRSKNNRHFCLIRSPNF